MSGATALGGIFSARAISFGVRPASRSSRTRSSNCCVVIRNILPLALERKAIAHVFASDDATEGMVAFGDKRTPAFHRR